MNLFSSILSLFRPTQSAAVADGTIIRRMGFKETDQVKEARQKAIENLEKWGRKSMLQGGAFSYNQNHVLNKALKNE